MTRPRANPRRRRGDWRRRVHRCRRCGKQAYSSYRRAERAAARLPIPGRVYWAPCGAWHITSSERAEYDRRAGGDHAGPDDPQEPS